MGEALDFQPYARPPRIDALGGIALVRRLVRVGYAGSNKATAQAFAKARTAATAVQDELKKRGRTARGSLRPLDAAFDTAWSGLRDRLKIWTTVADPAQQKDRARAEELLAAYFDGGVEFVKLAYSQEWVHSDQLLERFADEGALADIERLAGAGFVANVRVHHAKLGEALDLAGSARAEDAATSAGLAEKVAALAAAIGEYTRRHLGEVDTDDPKSVAAFRKAMAPIDAHRAAGSKTIDSDADPDPDSDPDSDPDDPTDPIPNLPPPFVEGG